ncbi:NCF2 factor, partial [Polypterus senegalus]
MALVEIIRLWDEAVAVAEKEDWMGALRLLGDVQEPNSKIHFNIGCLCLSNGNFQAAETAFDSSIAKDEHLAVAFFQRGVTFYKNEKYEEALWDFQKAFFELRGNQLIDYKLLGLRYKLYACEVLHNVALAHAQLSEWEKAEENLLKALNLKTEAKHKHIDRALESILKQKLFNLVELPPGVLFKPNRRYVAQLETKDYLGKAKVVASVVHQDEFSGFAPLQPQVQVVPSRPKTPEILRALEGEPHRVQYEFLSETPEELSVLPGNIVFVLEKAADNWATVIFNGKKGLVPYNFLEPVELIKGVKQDAQDEEEEVKLCTVKIHFTYTVAIRVKVGLAYSALLEKVSKKLEQPPSTIVLRYKNTGSNEKLTVDHSEMCTLWNQVQNGRLVLWCERTEPAIEGQYRRFDALSLITTLSFSFSLPVFKNKENELKNNQFVALYRYEAVQPEDLEFQAGDIINVLSKEKAREYLHKTGRFIVIGGIISPVHDSYGKQRVTGCILSNVNTPSTTPVIGQPQNGTRPIYQSTNLSNKPTAMEVIVGDFGIVVVPRDNTDTDRIINHSSVLRKYKDNIIVVKDDMNHPMSIVSSTKSRLALQHGDGHVVDYLSQPVIDYILQSQLYINTSG